MSAISKVFKKYGEITGRQYISLWYSLMLGMSSLESEEDREEYARRGRQYVHNKYGAGFENEFDSFVEANRHNEPLRLELQKRKAEFINKYFAVDLAHEIENGKGKNPETGQVSKSTNNQPITTNKPKIDSNAEQTSTPGKPKVETHSQQSSSLDKSKTINRRDIEYCNEYRESAFLLNPFNILNLKCDATRQDIAAAVDENEFLLGTEKCTAAQGALSNPIKRLTAELDWFPDINDILSTFLRSCVNQKLIIPLTSLGGVSKLNAMLFNLSLNSGMDAEELQTTVQMIDHDYCALNPESILQLINLLHEKAKIGQMTLADVERVLGQKRETIVRLLSELLQKLPERYYVSCVTKLAEAIKNTQDNSGVIISDIIDQYEIWVQRILESRMREIDQKIESIKTNADYEGQTKASIIKLIVDVKQWNNYAYPIEIRVGQTGIDNNNISSLAFKLRNLSIFLNNEKHQTDNAAILASELKNIFTQLPEVAERLEKDDSDLKGIQQEKQEREELEKANRQADKIYVVDVMGDSYSIPPFCTCCMKKTSNQETINFSSKTFKGRTTITHTTSVHLPICEECLKHRSEHKTHVILTRCLAAIIGVLITLAILILIKIEVFPAAIIGGAVALGMHLLLMNKRRTVALAGEHSSRIASANIFCFSQPAYSSLRSSLGASPDTSIRFTFTNWKYAQLFQQANASHASEVQERISTNSAKSTTYSEIDDKKGSSAFKTVAIFAVCAMLIAGFNQNKEITNLFPNSPLSIKSSQSNSGAGTKNTNSSTASSSTSKSANPTKAPSNNTTTQNTTSTSEKAYSTSSKTNDKVYVDVTSVFPSNGIYSIGGNNLSKNYHHFVCECKTSAGKKVYVYISTIDYLSYFDSSASTSYFGSNQTLNYSPAVRIHGKVISSSSVTKDLQKSINSSTVIEFSSVDKPKQKIVLSADNIDDYFDVSVTWDSWTDKKVKLNYSIKPKNSAYASRADSSADITVKLKITFSTTKNGASFQTKDYTVIVKKKNKYISSGSIDITLTKSGLSQVYWGYSVDSCEGSLGKD